MGPTWWPCFGIFVWNFIYNVLIGWRCLDDWQSGTLNCWLVQIKETAVWFWSKSAWLSQFGSDGDVLGFCLAVGELRFGSDWGMLGFHLADAFWFWSRYAWVLFGCRSLVLIEVCWGFTLLSQFGMASWACFTFIGGMILVTCYFLFLIYKFSTGGRLCALCAYFVGLTCCFRFCTFYGPLWLNCQK